LLLATWMFLALAPTPAPAAESGSSTRASGVLAHESEDGFLSTGTIAIALRDDGAPCAAGPACGGDEADPDDSPALACETPRASFRHGSSQTAAAQALRHAALPAYRGQAPPHLA